MPPKRKKTSRTTGSKKKKTIKGQTKITNYVKQEIINGEDKKCRCGRFFETDTRLQKHRKICDKKFKSLVDITTKSAISCEECSKKFRFNNSYTEHVRNEHSKTPGSVKCSKCPVTCPNTKILKNHIDKVHNREIFKCRHCGKKFVRQAHVLRHMEQTGCDGQGAAVYPCEICRAEFSRKDNLMVHLRLQHIIKKQFQCKECSYSTRVFSKLIIHVQSEHREKPQVFECDHCAKTTSSRAAMTKHLEIHGEKKYACDVCGYKTFTIEVMRRHVLTHVQEKPYKCCLCPSSFIQRVQLLRHLEKHNGNACQICDKTFGTKASMMLHATEHSVTLKKFVCPFQDCPLSNKELSSEKELRAHVKTHLEPDKPFKCEVCNKTFTSEVNMRRHVASHTLERPRRCMYCVAARAYVRGLQLVRHVRKSHPSVFREHLAHVRQVLGTKLTIERVKKSELESILNVLDAESERILQGYGEGVLYGGMQEADDTDIVEIPLKSEDNPLMTEEELAGSLHRLLSQLIDKEVLECFGWPDEPVDTVLEKVIEHCGAKAADREMWTRVQRLRENAKHLFLYVIEDKNIARMLDTHTIDQIVKHILAKVSDDADSINTHVIVSN